MKQNILDQIGAMCPANEVILRLTLPGKEMKKRFCSEEYGGGTSGFNDCDVLAYSTNHVFILREYDGKEWIVAIKRNP